MDKKRQNIIIRIFRRAMKLPKGFSLREATIEDIDSIMTVKEACSYKEDVKRIESGEKSKGFILGSTREKYLYYIQNAHVYMFMDEEKVAGFNVILPKKIALEGSTMTETIKLSNQDGVNGTVEDYIYYDQYCLHPDWANRTLAFSMIVILSKMFYDRGVINVYGSVVTEPIDNENSRKVLEGVGMKNVGTLDEEYGEIGSIKSVLYWINSKQWFDLL